MIDAISCRNRIQIIYVHSVFFLFEQQMNLALNITYTDQKRKNGKSVSKKMDKYEIGIKWEFSEAIDIDLSIQSYSLITIHRKLQQQKTQK